MPDGIEVLEDLLTEFEGMSVDEYECLYGSIDDSDVPIIIDISEIAEKD